MEQRYTIKRADELMDATLDAKWAARESIGGEARQLLALILRSFVDHSGPVDVRALPGADSEDARRRAVAELDEHDLILVESGLVVLAYPFAGRPTGFVTVLPGGRERHACCAVDALGIPAMLGVPVTIRARCHDCGDPLEFEVTPTGMADASGLMVWIGAREDLRAKACTTL